MFLVCHVISQDQVIKRSRNFMVRSHLVSDHPAKFGGHRHRDSGDVMVSVCHMILQDHAT